MDQQPKATHDLSMFLSRLAESTLCSPGQAQVACDTLVRSFAVSGLSLVDSPVHESGITSEGGAFECSVKVSHGDIGLRFIYDPLAWRDESAVRLATDHVGLWSETTSPLLSDLLGTLDLDSDFGGNFRVWLGAAISRTGVSSGKLYFNPDLSRARDGLLGMYQFLSTIGCDTKLIGTFREIMAVGGLFVPHIVGLNIGADGVKATKAYLVLPDVPFENLLRLADQRQTLLNRLVFLSELVQSDHGEVHIGLSFTETEKGPTYSLQFLASSWFDSQELAGSAASQLLKHEGVGSITRRAPRLSELGVTFVGVGQTASYVYVAPTRGGVEH